MRRPVLHGLSSVPGLVVGNGHDCHLPIHASPACPLEDYECLCERHYPTCSCLIFCQIGLSTQFFRHVRSSAAGGAADSIPCRAHLSRGGHFFSFKARIKPKHSRLSSLKPASLLFASVCGSMLVMAFTIWILTLSWPSGSRRLVWVSIWIFNWVTMGGS